MAIKVTLSNPSRVTKRVPVEDVVGEAKFDRAFYQYLGSLVKNKELLQDYTDNKIPLEYRRMLDEMNELYLKMYYPILGADIVVKPGIEELDLYLGSLGITEDYPYSKDTINIPAWLQTTSQTEYRILVDEDDNTFLTDSGGTEVLVAYT